MFYSQFLLSKTGALGVVWMAAHCHKRLKKHQIQQTNISSSVDKILDDEVRVVTHRILAFLLLGVVRIYSKKVEYLFNDCHEILNRLCSFKPGKSKPTGSGVSWTHNHTISLPKRFELDIFDLDHLEDQDVAGGSVRSLKQVGRRNGGSSSGLLYKDSLQALPDNVPVSEAQSKAFTPPRDVFGPNHMDQNLFVDPSSNLKISLADVDVLRGTRFSLDSIQVDEAEEEQMHKRFSDQDIRNNMDSDSDDVPSNKKSHLLPSLVVLRGTVFALEDRLEPMVLDEAEQEQLNGRSYDLTKNSSLRGPIQDVGFETNHGSGGVASFGVLDKSGISLVQLPNLKISNEAEKEGGDDKVLDEEEKIVEEHVGPPSTQLDFLEVEHENVTVPIDEEKPVDAGVKVVEVNTPETVKCKKQEGISIVTADSKIPAGGGGGGGTPEVATVQTPGRKERAKILRKRKTLLDSTTVVSNKVFKNWIDDPTDLKRKRREVPHTLLDVWRAHKHAHIPQSFFEPSISGVSEDLGYLQLKMDYAQEIKEVEISNEQDGVKSSATYGAQEQIPIVGSTTVREELPGRTQEVRSPIMERSPCHTPIAPGTPAAHPHEAVAVAYSDIIEPATSYESIVKGPSSSDPLDLDPLFQEETSSSEGNSLERDIFSARTRLAASYLSRKFLDKKRRKEEEVLSLSRLMAGKTKKESARLFYEILVLKTRDCIDVLQETAYRDVLLCETPKLRQSF